MQFRLLQLTWLRCSYALLLLNQASLGQAHSDVASRSISLRRLQHNVPKKAQKLYFDAKVAWERDDMAAAAGFLENAIALDEQFFEATNNLGVMYLRQGRLNDALAMFRRATQIDGSDSQAELNLAYVLLRLSRFSEAEEAARASLRGDPKAGWARICLAVSLLEQGKKRAEAIFHLKQASDELEEARKLLKMVGQ